MAFIGHYKFDPDELENLPEQPLELLGPESERPEDYDPSEPPSLVAKASIESVPIHQQERLKPHWNQFVDLLRGGNQEVQAANLSVLKSIKEEVSQKEDEYEDRIAEQEKYIEALEDGNVTMYGIEPHPRRIEQKLESAREKMSDYREAKSFLTARRLAANKMYRRFVVWGRLPVRWDKLSDSEKEEIEKGKPPITGYFGPQYAIEANQVLNSKTITSFTDLEREIGGSKVDTVKRNIGYDDLPREVKEEEGFQRFETMLKEKVEQMEED